MDALKPGKTKSHIKRESHLPIKAVNVNWLEST